MQSPYTPATPQNLGEKALYHYQGLIPLHLEELVRRQDLSAQVRRQDSLAAGHRRQAVVVLVTWSWTMHGSLDSSIRTFCASECSVELGRSNLLEQELMMVG